MKTAIRIVTVVLALICVRAIPVSGSECSSHYEFLGEAAGDRFGRQVAAAGDVNDDNYTDIIIGAPSESGAGTETGKAYIYLSQNGELHLTFSGEAAGDNFGWAVAGAGDVDLDGFDDVIIGAYNHNGATGRAYVFSGKKGDTIHVFSGGSAGDEFGYSVNGVGDVNDDGHADVVIGAIRDDVGGTNRGAAYVFSGADGSLLHTFIGDGSTEFGFSVAGAGDVDKDDFADIIVGQPAYAGSTGKAYIYSGQSGNLISSFLGEWPGDAFGWSVDGMGDANQDGYPDVVVGAPFYDG